MASSIHYNSDLRSFFLRLRTSFYAIRILDCNELVHMDSGPLPEGALLGGDFQIPTLEDLGNYDESNFVWETQARRWELPTFGDISYHDSALKVSFPAGPESRGPIRDLRLRYISHSISTDTAPGLAASRSDTRETLSIVLKDIQFDFYATVHYRITVEHDIIERWVTLNNKTNEAVTVESLSFGAVHLPNARYELTRVAGTWAREFIPVRQVLEQGRTVLESTGLNTGHSANPFYHLSEVGKATEESGPIYFGALAYSGNWNLRFEILPTGGVRVYGGYDQSDFELKLAPGESHTTPAIVHGCANDGHGGASRRLHRFTREYVLPQKRHGDFRPVLYNSWEAVYFDMSYDSQVELARKAAAIGIELFCVDDGWFGGRRNDSAGLGDWTVSPAVFPGGLTPLIDEVKRLGMRFGLWVEPEMVNPDSDLYRQHPNWVLHFDGRPRTEIRQQLILDFGQPEVVAFIYESLNRLVAEHDISFFKWDMNRYATEPGSVTGRAVWRKHVAGVYKIMDGLRDAHPGLEIQSCSGGGGRIDLGILQRTDQVWTSDNTDAVDRVQIQEGFSLAYPPRAMESWVTHELNHQSSRLTSLDLRFDVAMRGALGVGTSLNQLSDAELDNYALKIAFYKKIRPTVQTGDLFRLASTPDRSVWFTIAADKSTAVLSVVVTGQLQGVFTAPSRLPGLIPEAIYQATDETGATVGKWSGFQLGALGFPGEGKLGGAGKAIRSRTVFLAKLSDE